MVRSLAHDPLVKSFLGEKTYRTEETIGMEKELAAFGCSTKMRHSVQRGLGYVQPIEEEDSQSNAAPGAETASTAAVPERVPEETAETEQMGSNISRVGAQSAVLAKAKEERLIKKCAAVLKDTRSATFLQNKKKA